MAATDRRLWWQLFGALALATTAWSLAAPLMSGHDEAAHAVRGAAVVRRQMLGEPNPEAFPSEPNVLVDVEVPEAYLLAGRAGCFNKQRVLTPECAPDVTGGWDTERVLTYQFRSPPTYYAVVGWPSLVSPDAPGMYGMRIVNGLLCAALLASALLSARLARRPRWTVLGVAVAVTPELLYLASTINSNAVEVAAAVGLWSGLAAIARVDDPLPHRLVARTGLALVVLVGTRGLSPLFAGLAGLAVAALLSRARLATLLRRRDVQAWGGAAAVTAAASLAYVEWVRRQLPIERPGQGLTAALDRLPWYLRQGVGIFGSNDIPLPDPVYALWGVALGAVVLLAVVVAPLRRSVVVLAVLAVGVGIQVTAEGFSLPPIGFFWQGRYALPVLVGVPILATSLAAEARERGAGRVDRLTPVVGPLLVLLGAAQVTAFLQTVRRFAVTLDGPSNPLTYLFSPRWSPDPGPAPLWAALFTVGLAVAGRLALQRTPVTRGTG